MHRKLSRTPLAAKARLAIAAGAVIAPLVTADFARGTDRPPPVLTSYSILNHVQLTSYVASPVQSPPINGFVPQVVYGLTNEDDPDAPVFEAIEATLTAGATPPGSGNNWMPNTSTPSYRIATFDTGAQAHIISYTDAPSYGFGTSTMTENYVDILGASGSEEAQVSKPLGIYMNNLSAASNVGGTINATGTLIGQYDASLLRATQSNSVLPNIIGAPMMAQYQVTLENSKPQTLTVGATTYHSPKVTLTSLASDPPLPSSYYRLTLDVQSPSGVSPYASYIPDIDLNTFELVPVQPTFWMSMFANVSGTNGANSATNKQFLFDTGAQVTVFSQDTAAEFGFYSGGPEPSTPEFFVDVEGVGGTIQVPGFTVDTLKVLTNGGYVTWNKVPVLVLDLPDARDGVGFLPGVLGMNLFTDRDLILNGGLTNPAVAFSQQFQWNINAGGVWGTASNWVGGVPDTATHAAQFLGKITSPQTITVPADYTIGNLTFDNANRYTLSGAGRLTLQAFDSPAVIGVYSGSHTINAPLTLASDTVINIAQVASKLTINSAVTATGIDLTKAGLGTVEMSNVRADSLALEGGTVSIFASGANAATSILKSISATNGKMDLQNNKLIVRGVAGGGTGVLGTWNGSAYSGVTGLVADDHLITSQSLAVAPNFRTTLGVATADQIGRVGQTFGGQTVLTGDVLVMYTWAGDADFDGLVDGDDFVRIDTGFAGNLKGWFNGDFDYSGVVDADDYWLIDRGYFYRGSQISSAVSAVPEPTGIWLILAGLLSAARRRRV